MPPRFEDISTITAKGQTTVPKSVRAVLGIEAGDRIAFRVQGRGVTVHRVDEAEDDPAIDGFLAFLARDIANRPEALTALSPALARRVAELTKGVAIDPEAEIDGEVDL